VVIVVVVVVVVVVVAIGNDPLPPNPLPLLVVVVGKWKQGELKESGSPLELVEMGPQTSLFSSMAKEAGVVLGKATTKVS